MSGESTVNVMTVAVLGGTGKEGSGLAMRWAQSGYRVVIGSREAERAAAKADELNEVLGDGAIVGLQGGTDEVRRKLAALTAQGAAIAGVCQAIEHYEIARYGTLREWAKTLKNDEAHVLLSEILDMEKAANNKLNAIAINSLNKD